MKVLIIGNPIASGGNAGKKITELKEILEKRGHAADAYLTKFAGDGKERISRVSDDTDRIVIAGGDGTVNEIINGIPDGFSIPILQMPTGNANLLGHELNLPKDVQDAADLLENGKIIMADMAQMNGTRFIMVAGAGLDARVTEEVKKNRTGRVNNLTYAGSILKALKNPSPAEYDVVVDDKKFVRGAAVLVCNVRNYAGICEVAWEADVCSRTLDIIVFPKDNFLSFLKYLMFAKFSRVTKLDGVSYLKGKKVRITSRVDVPVELDGDFNGRHSVVDIEIMNQQVPLVVPG